MVVDEATAGMATLIGKRCLDPACGSGIFLVILFNRIAEEIERRHPRSDAGARVSKLLAVLENQICGVDVNQTACRIACFSLYVAFLDQFDPPALLELRENSGKVLPKLLAYKDSNYQNTETPVIFEGNFFDPELPVGGEFDVIVGNPPWIGRKNSADTQVVKWTEDETANSFLKDAPRSKAKRKAIFLPQKQLAHAFMWKALLHVRDAAHICLLLPVQVLLNRTDAFQHAWFSKTDVSRIINLSDFRWFLFQDAERPAVIIRFGPIPPALDSKLVEYVVPKARQQDPRSGLIKVFPDDRKWVRRDDMIRASEPGEGDGTDSSTGSATASIFWKTLLWGTARDVAFIEYLRSLDCLGDIAGDPGEGKRWIKGQGFQPWYQVGFDASPVSYGSPKPIPGDLEDPFIRTVDSIQLFAQKRDTITLRERLASIRCKGYPEGTSEDLLRASLKGFRRSPDSRIFEPPLVLINKGFNKFAFADFKVFYQHSLTGLSGDPCDADLLRFFTVYAGSRLAKYFLFHTAGSWGTERPEVRVHELMRLPFPLPTSPDSHDDAEEIVKDVSRAVERLQSKIAGYYRSMAEAYGPGLDAHVGDIRRECVEQLQEELECRLYKYFKLTKEEIILIDDTCDVISRSATPTSPDKQTKTTQPTKPEQRLGYAGVICDRLNSWSKSDQPKGQKRPFFFRADVASFPAVGQVLLTLHQSPRAVPPKERQAGEQIEGIIRKLTELASYQQGSFEFLRGVIFGNGNKIHILKPDMLGQWTRTAALNDADQVFHAIVQSKGNDGRVRR